MTNNNKKVWTIPNVLSMIRIGLVPLIIYLYLCTNFRYVVGILILMSGLTDIVDGYIARHFNQVSDLGKVLDPIADKLTLISILSCVAYKHTYFIIILGAEVVKDFIVCLSGLYRVHKNKTIHCADWEGKVCTFTIYTVTFMHIVFIYNTLTSAIITISASSIILLLGIKYAVKNIFSTSPNFS